MGRSNRSAWFFGVTLFLLLITSLTSSAFAERRCAPTITPDLAISIPQIRFGNDQNTLYSATLQYMQQGPDQGVWFVVTTAASHPAPSGCGGGIPSITQFPDKISLNIPALFISPSSYFVSLVYVPTTDGKIWFKVANFRALTMSDYWPLNEGMQWSYERDILYQGTNTPDFYTQSVSGTELIDGVNATKISDDTGYYDLWTSDTNGYTRYKSHGTDGSKSWDFVFNPGYVVLPNTLFVGQTQNSQTHYTYTCTNGCNDSGTWTWHLSVDGNEEIYSDAMYLTFGDCFRISGTLTQTYDGYTDTYTENVNRWYCQGVGRVAASGQVSDSSGDSYTYTDNMTGGSW